MSGRSLYLIPAAVEAALNPFAAVTPPGIFLISPIFFIPFNLFYRTNRVMFSSFKMNS